MPGRDPRGADRPFLGSWAHGAWRNAQRFRTNFEKSGRVFEATRMATCTWPTDLASCWATEIRSAIERRIPHRPAIQHRSEGNDP